MGHPHSAPPKAFLDLPGELRNRIYDIAIASIDSVARLVAPLDAVNNPDLHDFYSDLQSAATPRTPDSNWSSSNRPLQGLTQTCRQLRAEFRPMYMYHLKVLLGASNVYEYLHTVVFPGEHIEDVEHPNCWITILATDSDAHHMGDSPSIDLKALFQRCIANPGMEIDVRSYCSPTSGLQQVLGFSDDWPGFLDQNVVNMDFCPRPGSADVCVTVKKEIAEPWMPPDPGRRKVPRLFPGGPSKLTIWMEKLEATKSAWLEERGMVWKSKTVYVRVEVE